MYKETRSSDSAAALPVALWAEILQHVPQQQRLIQCALVCTAWAHAAAQATVDVTHKLWEDFDPALNRWLALHAGQLRSLQLEPQKDWQLQCTLHLPLNKLTKLQRLQLKHIELQLPSDKDSNGSSPNAGSKGISDDGTGHAVQMTLPSLQHLELDSVKLDGLSSLLQLTKAPHLTSLSFERVYLADLHFSTHTCPDNQAAVQEVAAAVPGMLQQLPLLKVLQLPNFPLTDAAVQQLSAMQQLQKVSLAHVTLMPTCSLQPLPSSITRLELSSHTHDDVGPSLPQEVPQLSGLLELDLGVCAVFPRVLGSFTQLRLLHLKWCQLRPCDPDAEYDTEGTAALLEVLPSLTCLQDLHVNVRELDAVSVAPQHFAALTASSQLTQLQLTRDFKRPLARGAVQHMFPSGRQMPLLQQLTINMYQEGLLEEDEWCLDSADIDHILNCCTRLQLLDIGSTVQPGADLSALLQLPQSCTFLYIGGYAFTDATAPVIRQLTQLKELVWTWSPGFKDAGLEQLVGLDLSWLQVHSSGLSEIDPDDPGDVNIKFSCVLGSVSKQLDALCDLSPVLAPTRLRKCRKAAAASQRELAKSQAEVERLKQQLAEAGKQH